jgi:predicted nucleotide-binding protein (sugar kinase/HSP70/actin superfamily)
MGTVNQGNGFKLPVLGEEDIEAQLRAFEEEEAAKLGLKAETTHPTEHWVDKMISPDFKASRRKDTTLLISGLTQAHDYLIQGGLKGLGYSVEVIDCPDNEALRYGKEFGNRGQCNPTYFTVGNLVKFLTERAARDGLSPAEIVDKYVFVTAGACGPCRFGMYATEYRKALRDAGFDGFRVLLFQQKGGLKQATGDEPGLLLNPKFFLTLLTAIIAGDVINGMGYRLRPFEIEAGATDKAIEKTKKWVHEALSSRTSVLRALWRGKAEFAKVKCDWTRPAPRVSIIGEFWAMTTEGDGNYQLQRFLESEGAECDIQFVTNWLLFMLWEGRYDTKLRAELRGLDSAKKSLKDAAFGKKLLGLFVADLAIRGAFHTFGAAIGYRGYHLPDMDLIAETADKYYNNQVRGGEGHMEVGKFILNVLHNKSTMTLSVKPFGCMPSSGVSDGVQSMITGMYPQSIFCAIETSGDGKVNVHSRVQMFLFKARLAAQKEYADLLQKLGTDAETVKAFFDKHGVFASPLHRAPHSAGATAADRLAEVAPYLGKSDLQIRVLRARAAVGSVVAAAKAAPGFVAGLRKKLVERGPVLMAQAREEWKDARPAFEAKARATVNAGVAKVTTQVTKLAGRRPAPTAEVQATA